MFIVIIVIIIRVIVNVVLNGFMAVLQTGYF